ncbi:MarR family transcriptional regulator [Acutalibacter caecimuris]|uniref:MarR family transcriptional regulator n=1 Tax=Acutalibacter caecimuris TaxID=3093657 RepID=UPI002AC9BBD6|nr:MarR family transcriptional regulator [Acutalibacter sp. M00118]
MDTRTGFLITQIKQVQGRVFQRLLDECGVDAFNGAQGHILYVLWQQDRVPIATLVRGTGLAKNTLTAMLARMEAQGLVVRGTGPQDRRQVLVALTEKARGLREQYEQVSQEMNRLFYQGLTQEDATLLDSLLDRVLLNLEMCETRLKNQKKGEVYDGKNQRETEQ